MEVQTILAAEESLVQDKWVLRWSSGTDGLGDEHRSCDLNTQDRWTNHAHN